MSTRAAWRALGTTATVVVTDPAGLADARSAVVDELAAIDRACSRFRGDSELSAVNRGAGGPVGIGPLLAHAIAVALQAARTTGGLVDPTLGADLRRAGYDRDFDALTSAATDADGDEDEPQAASEHEPLRRGGAWSAVRLDEAAGVVRVPSGVQLDLGATAKALAADRAADAAHRATGCGVLVSLGGDVALAGPPPAEGWAIRVMEDHAAPLDADGQTVTIRSGGLATSGTTVRRWRSGGQPRHHIIDPRTGAPAVVVWRTASVAAVSCVEANVASTAAIVRGVEAAPWLLQRGLPARLVALDGRVLHVGAWPARAPGSSPSSARRRRPGGVDVSLTGPARRSRTRGAR